MTARAPTTSDGLLINRITLRGPELEVLFAHLTRAGGATRRELLERFVPLNAEGQRAPSDTVRSAVDALLTLGLVVPSAPAEAGGVPSYAPRPLPPGEDFRAAMLRALRALTDRQAALMDLYAWCVRGGHLLVGKDDLLNAARRDVPIDAGWSSEKIDLWGALGEFVGLLLPTRGGVVVAPRPDRLCRWLAANAGTAEVWAADAFAAIDRDLAPCFTARGELHPGWTQALGVLAARGLVRLGLGSDAPRVLRARLETGEAWSRLTVAPPAGRDAPR